MARYEYRCPDGHVIERHKPMERRDDAPVCLECGQQMSRVLYPMDMIFKMGRDGLVQSRYGGHDGVGMVGRTRRRTNV